MEEASKITTDVETLEKNVFHGLHKRMDDDFDRWGLKRRTSKGSAEYVAKNWDKINLKDTDIEIVSNAPRTFADSVQSVLSSSERSIIIRMAQDGKDMREEIAQLERLMEYGFEKADERLLNRLEPTLKESLVWYSIIRGWLAGRFLVYKDGDEIVWDYLHYDPRWLVWQRGKNGLLWTAYTDSYTPGELEDEWGSDKIEKKPWYKPWQKSKNSYDVIDYWLYEGKGKISNAVICEKEFLKDPETYDMSSFPVLISPVATRPPIKTGTQNEMEGYGESIFAPNRDIDDLINACGSMWASHANLLFRQPTINYYGENGVQLTTTAYMAEAVVNLPMNQNRLEPSPMKEISPTLVNLVNWLDSMRVRGSLPDIRVSNPPQSGTLQSLILEESNRVFNPQIRNLNSFYSNICRLVEEQLLEGGVGKSKIKKVNVRGGERNKDYYEFDIKPVDLKRPHIIKVEFTARNRWEQFETYQIADMAKRQGLPDGFINEYILKLPDPKGLGDLSAIEMAEHSPKLAMLRAIKALLKQERFEEANQLIEDMYNIWVQETANAGQARESMAGQRVAGTPDRTLPLPEAEGTSVQQTTPGATG